MKHRDTRYWSFWDKDVVIFKSVNDGIVAFWRHPMTEDIVVLEMQMMVTVAFEGMQWLKTLSSSKCKWWSLLPLKAYNDWRHCLLRNVNEGIVAFWRHAMIEDIVVFEMSEDIVAYEGMQWLKTFLSSKCVRLPYRASLHATWLLTGQGSINVCTDNPWVSLDVIELDRL